MGLFQFPLKRLELEPFEAGAPKPDRLIEGSPRFRTWTFDVHDGDTMFSGVWESTPGKWRIAYDEWEFCSILSGESLIEGDDGSRLHVRAGDSFALKPGFAGTWQVIDTTRKLFVVKV
jgi:uncharacterized cupin superfamily protein